VFAFTFREIKTRRGRCDRRTAEYKIISRVRWNDGSASTYIGTGGYCKYTHTYIYTVYRVTTTAVSPRYIESKNSPGVGFRRVCVKVVRPSQATTITCNVRVMTICDAVNHVNNSFYRLSVENAARTVYIYLFIFSNITYRAISLLHGPAIVCCRDFQQICFIVKSLDKWLDRP